MNQVEKDNFLEIFKYLPIEKPVLIVLNIYQFFMKMFPRFLSFIFKLGIFWEYFLFLFLTIRNFLI